MTEPDTSLVGFVELRAPSCTDRNGLQRTTTENAGWEERMDTTTKQRLLDAAEVARRRYPGPVGELLSQELLSWMVFGHHIGSVLILRVADHLTTRRTRSVRGEVDVRYGADAHALPPLTTSAG